MKLDIKNLKRGILIGCLLAVSSAHATEFVQADQFISNEGVTLTNELWISAQTITLNGTASRDLFTISSLLTLQGTFEGDVWSGGDNIIASGTFNDDLRLFSRAVL